MDGLPPNPEILGVTPSTDDPILLEAMAKRAAQGRERAQEIIDRLRQQGLAADRRQRNASEPAAQPVPQEAPPAERPAPVAGGAGRSPSGGEGGNPPVPPEDGGTELPTGQDEQPPAPQPTPTSEGIGQPPGGEGGEPPIPPGSQETGLDRRVVQRAEIVMGHNFQVVGNNNVFIVGAWPAGGAIPQQAIDRLQQLGIPVPEGAQVVPPLPVGAPLPGGAGAAGPAGNEPLPAEVPQAGDLLADGAAAANEDEAPPEGPAAEEGEGPQDQEEQQEEEQPENGQPNVEVLGRVSNPEAYRYAAARLFNELARLNNERLEDLHGRGVIGRVRSWFSRRFQRQYEADPNALLDLEEAGRVTENNPRVRPWLKAAAKIVGGFGVASAVILAGAGVPVWGGAALAAKVVAPIATMLGVKTGLSGVIEAAQNTFFGRGKRMREVADAQVAMEAGMERMRIFFREREAQGRVGENLTPEEKADFMARWSALLARNTELTSKDKANITGEQKNRQWRTWGSTVGALAFGFLGGVPLGVTDLDATGTPERFGNLAYEHGTVVKPFANILSGENVFQSEFFYNNAMNELDYARQFAAETGAPLREVTNFFGLATHTVGNNLAAGVEAKWGIGAALAALFGMHLGETATSPNDTRTVEQRGAARAQEEEGFDRFLPREGVPRPPEDEDEEDDDEEEENEDDDDNNPPPPPNPPAGAGGPAGNNPPPRPDAPINVDNLLPPEPGIFDRFGNWIRRVLRIRNEPPENH